MVLTQQELKSLVEVKTRSPHQLLGLHSLGDGSGLVARALLPDAAKVEIQPVHEKDKPGHQAQAHPRNRRLRRRHHGRQPRLRLRPGHHRPRGQRPPHPRCLFLPAHARRRRTSTSSARATSAASTTSSARNCAPSTASPAPASPSGRPTPSASASWAISTTGMAGVHPMRSLGSSGVWEIFIPGVGEGTHYKFEIRDLPGPHRPEDRSLRLLLRDRRPRTPPLSGTPASFTGPMKPG